jgi:hypothetical protein
MALPPPVFLEERIDDLEQQALDAADRLRHLRVHQQPTRERQRLRLQGELSGELHACAGRIEHEIPAARSRRWRA